MCKTFGEYCWGRLLMYNYENIHEYRQIALRVLGELNDNLWCKDAFGIVLLFKNNDTLTGKKFLPIDTPLNVSAVMYVKLTEPYIVS
jgi:hypothetical protein